MTVKALRMRNGTVRYYDLNKPSSLDVSDIQAAVDALSHLSRFSGAAGHYSVGEHSVLVARLVPPWAVAAALVHDLHEVWADDITTPVAAALDARVSGFAVAYTRLKREIDYRIASALDFASEYLKLAAPHVEIADRLALRMEAEAFFGVDLDVEHEHWPQVRMNLRERSLPFMAARATREEVVLNPDRAYSEWMASVFPILEG